MKELPYGTIVYYPYLRKHPEKSALLSCKDELTRHGQIIINPARNLPVDSTPIFNPKTLTCHHP